MNTKISEFVLYSNTTKALCKWIFGSGVCESWNFYIKSDVFSFGVLILEIISGQKVSKFSQTQNGETLLSFAWRNWLEGNALRVLDSTISAADTNEVLRCIHIALLCVQENATQRPIMSSVVLMLNSHSVTISVPSKPAFLASNDVVDPLLESEQRPRLDESINEASLSTLDPR
uniref:Serine-threonine/tyrosine-protein kinase catalytic domain-containing protein n=2 Tax=Chenopodium quinoa TaxID=63459 RepID=A0A803LKV7_CHEQI